MIGVEVDYAVTPTDTRGPGRAVPALPAARAANDPVVALALVIADGAVQSDIDLFSDWVEIDGNNWFDTAPPPSDMRKHAEDRALCQEVTERAVRYIGLRHPDAFPWRFVRHPERPELVRFESKA